jgi:hypothetical protein
VLSGPIIAENGVAGKYLVVDYERKQCKVMDTMIIRVVIVQSPHRSSPSGGRDWEEGRVRIGASETLALPGIRDCPILISCRQ